MLKMAASLDGRVATRTGNTRWISGPEARALVHRWRAEMDAVAVGIGTAVADDPMLTARDVDVPVGREALRVVLDPHARLPLDAALLGSLDQAPVLVITGSGAPADRVDALRAAGAQVVRLTTVPDSCRGPSTPWEPVRCSPCWWRVAQPWRGRCSTPISWTFWPGWWRPW
jgi:diaminohydroxyphosphoribosylaminopyrimidine deaminase/5-amino-6-(5-phosphoribosylamino)uracil reductase